MERPIWTACLILLLAGCGRGASVDEIEEIRLDALTALAEARRANEALDYGSSSGTNMGNELQEAMEAAEDAKAELLVARAEIAELESRIEAICLTAPQICY